MQVSVKEGGREGGRLTLDILTRDQYDKAALFWATEENQADGIQVSVE